MKIFIKDIFLYIIITFAIISIASCNEKKQFDGYLYPIRENGLYGYIDSVGNRIIEPEFLWASTFHNGLAMAVVDTIYCEVPDSMAYEVGERDTVINMYRMYVKYGYIDKTGIFLIKPTFVCYISMPQKGYQVKDLKECSNALNSHVFRNNRALYSDTTTWKNGYIDKKGKVVIPPKYYYSDPFFNGKAIVMLPKGEQLLLNDWIITQGKLRSAYIDTTGNAITDFKYEKLTRFNGRCGIGSYKEIVRNTSGINDGFTEHNYIIDENGAEIKDLSFWNQFYGFSKDGIGLARQVMRLQVSDGMSDSYSYVDEKGNYLEPLKGLSKFQLDSISRCEDIIQVLPEDAEISYATHFNEGFAGISPDGEHWFVIDKYLLIHGYGEESVFEKFKVFNNGLAAVKKNGKWGYINKQIKEQIPCKYDSCGLAYPFLEEVFEYDIQGKIKKVAYINRQDSLVWESNVPDYREITNKYSFKEKKDWGKWTYKYNPIIENIKYWIIVGLGIVLIIALISWESVRVSATKRHTVMSTNDQSLQMQDNVENNSSSNNISVTSTETEEIHFYPSVRQYTETIKLSSKSPEEFFDKLSNLRPVFDENGDPIMSNGNFAVVYKMVDGNGKFHAIRCFHRYQERRGQSYKLICEELNKVSSSYLLPIKYYEKELYIDSVEYPVLLMDWVDGVPLDKYLREIINDNTKLRSIAVKFRQLAIWLLDQPFAHGDLKPDNILVKKDGSLVLVDYDGMFVPAMQGERSRELGSPDFRNPSRTETDFDKNIDNFPIISILLSLELLIENKDYLSKFGAEDRLLFSEENYRYLEDCKMFQIASKSLRNNISDLVKLLREELSGIKHLPSEIVFIISGEKREKEYHANDKIDLFANILFGLYSIFILAFPLVAFNIFEWRVINISSLMLGSNVIAYLLFNTIDSCRPNKEYHILNESTIGCLGTPAAIIPIFFMASSSYEEEWYITAIIWIVSWLSLMSYFGITSLKDEGISKFFTKKKEKIYRNDIIEGLQMAFFLAPAFGFPLLIVMIMDKGWDSFFVWLKYVAIVDTIGLFGVIISLIYKRLGK